MFASAPFFRKRTLGKVTKWIFEVTVSRAAIVTKSIDGAVSVFAVVDVVAVEPGAGTDDNVGRGAIIAVGTGRVLKIRSASVIRARIFSIPSERAVARIAALFSGVKTDAGGGIGLGSGLDACVVAGF